MADTSIATRFPEVTRRVIWAGPVRKRHGHTAALPAAGREPSGRWAEAFRPIDVPRGPPLPGRVPNARRGFQGIPSGRERSCGRDDAFPLALPGVSDRQAGPRRLARSGEGPWSGPGRPVGKETPTTGLPALSHADPLRGEVSLVLPCPEGSLCMRAEIKGVEGQEATLFPTPHTPGLWWTRGLLPGAVEGVRGARCNSDTVLGLPATPVPLGGSNPPSFPFRLLGRGSCDLASLPGRPVLVWSVATVWSSGSQSPSPFTEQSCGQCPGGGLALLEERPKDSLGQPGPGLSTLASPSGFLSQAAWVPKTSDLSGTDIFDPFRDLDLYRRVNLEGTSLGAQGLPGNLVGVFQTASGQ